MLVNLINEQLLKKTMSLANAINSAIAAQFYQLEAYLVFINKEHGN